MDTARAIQGFKNEYRFLSNFWPVEVYYDGLCYPSVEHAYQAAKTLNLDERDDIRRLITPGEAKRAGRKVTKRDDWEEIKQQVMYELVKQKFFRDPQLRASLMATEDRHIEETNDWGDTFWGVSHGLGMNRLGIIVMKIRTELFELERIMGVNLRQLNETDRL